MQGKIFTDSSDRPSPQVLGPGAVLLPDLIGSRIPDLLAAIQTIEKAAPFRHMSTPGGFRMSVAMTNCGQLGWVTDRRGYRYSPTDPESGHPWPPMPEIFGSVALQAAVTAGYPDFHPDACLINRYAPGARMTLHQDKDEPDLAAPIVSASLGLPATFQFGGLTRKDRPMRYKLLSGDVVVWGGASRLFFHGVSALADGVDPLAGPFRYNLTFRKAGYGQD